MTDQPVPDYPDPVTTPPRATRRTFNDEVVARSHQFAHDLMQLVPEVEGVAIVPSFSLPQEHFPFGIVVGRNGALRNPAEIMHMAVQLHGALRHHLEAAFQTLRSIDDYMGDRRKLLQELEAQIRERQQQLEQQTRERSTGTPPGTRTTAGDSGPA